MKRIQSLSLFLLGVAFWVSSCANNNSPTDSQKTSSLVDTNSNKVLFSIENHKNEIWSLVQKATDFNTMLNELDSFAVAYECDSLQKMEILDVSVGVFNSRLSDSTSFLKSVMEYLATNKTRIIPKNYLESILSPHLDLGNYPKMDMVYQYKQMYYPKDLQDEHTFEDGKTTLTTWGHTARYLAAMAKLSAQKLEAGEMLFKKALLLRRLQMDAKYYVNPVYENTVYKKMFVDVYSKFPKSSYADDAAFAEIEDCVSRPEGCALPYVVYECLQKKEKLLTLYPNADIMDKILASLIADYSLCHGCESYHSHNDSPAEIIRKTKGNIKKGISCLEKLRLDYPSTPQKKLDSLEHLLKEAEERVLWNISVKPSKRTYKMGEPIKLQVTFNWPSDANFNGDVLGYKGLAEIHVFIQNKGAYLIQEPYEMESLQSIKTLAPGTSFTETVTIIPQGSPKKNSKSIEMNLTPGKHKCNVTYLFDHYDSMNPSFTSKEVDIIVE